MASRATEGTAGNGVLPFSTTTLPAAAATTTVGAGGSGTTTNRPRHDDHGASHHHDHGTGRGTRGLVRGGGNDVDHGDGNPERTRGHPDHPQRRLHLVVTAGRRHAATLLGISCTAIDSCVAVGSAVALEPQAGVAVLTGPSGRPWKQATAVFAPQALTAVSCASRPGVSWWASPSANIWPGAEVCGPIHGAASGHR